MHYAFRRHPDPCRANGSGGGYRGKDNGKNSKLRDMNPSATAHLSPQYVGDAPRRLHTLRVVAQSEYPQKNTAPRISIHLCSS
jgi:hypothetical protein